jgi:hypothetical protein
MKRLFSLIVGGAFIIGLAAAGSAAEKGAMDHCGNHKNGTHACDEKVSGHDHHNHHQHHQGHGASSKELAGNEMAAHIVPMSMTLSDTMKLISRGISRDMSPDAMKKWAEAFDAVSSQSLRLSDIMNNGKADEGELHMLHQEIDNTAKNLQ